MKPGLTADFFVKPDAVSAVRRAGCLGQPVLPAFAPSHCAERSVARPDREPVKTVLVTRRRCAFDRFAGVGIGSNVLLQLQV